MKDLSLDNRRTKIGIMTPCYNEEAGIRECYERVREVMATMLADCDYEHLFIDNCSMDGTVGILREIAAGDDHVRVIVNSRNFGLGRSPFHGLMSVSGDVVVPIFADLQTPPDIIPQMMAEWRRGFKIVAAIRENVKQSFAKRVMRKIFYAIFERLSNVEFIPHFFGFGLYDRKVIEVIPKPERIESISFCSFFRFHTSACL